MTKKHLPNLWQVLMIFGKTIVRIMFWGFFFLLRATVFYYFMSLGVSSTLVGTAKWFCFSLWK